MKKFKIIYGTTPDAFEIIEAKEFSVDFTTPGMIYFYADGKTCHVTPKTSTVIEIK